MYSRVAGLLLFAAAAAASNDGPRIDELIRAEMARQRIPGLAVGVVRNGEIIRAQGYGEANLEHRVPVTPDTIFQSGSVGKQFTAALIMLLVEDGKVSLSDPLTTYFADAPPVWRTVTVRHLLTHTSGLPEYTDGTLDLRRDYTEEELLRFAYGLTLEFPPGARWNYSNTGYVVLGILIRKATGRFYGDVLRDRIFEPLGMRTARVISEADIVPNRAAGYRIVDGQVKNQDWVSPTLNTTADGALYLSLRDMMQWDKGLREKRLLGEESWRQVITPVSLTSGRPFPYGFGWRVEPVAGHASHFHGGTWQGFQTHIARYPADDVSIVVLSNLGGSDPGRVAEGIAGILNPELKRPELKPIDDREPATRQRVTELLVRAAAGILSPSQFAYVPAGFFPDTARRYARLLSDAGAVQRLTLLEVRELGDDRVFTYDVSLARAVLRLRIGFAPDGRLVAFALRRTPE